MTVITIQTPGSDTLEIYRTLTQMARAKSISYHTLKGRAFPIFYKGLKINKVDVQK